LRTSRGTQKKKPTNTDKSGRKTEGRGKDKWGLLPNCAGSVKEEGGNSQDTLAGADPRKILSKRGKRGCQKRRVSRHRQNINIVEGKLRKKASKKSRGNEMGGKETAQENSDKKHQRSNTKNREDRHSNYKVGGSKKKKKSN